MQRSFEMADMSVLPGGPAPSAPSSSYNFLMNAISSGVTDLVRQYITQEPELTNMFGWHRQTALHRACLMGSMDIVNLLLDSGADPNARNNFDETPLHYACKRGMPHIVNRVLEKGGDVTLVDKLGKGVIHHAAEAGTVPVLHLLKLKCPELPFLCQDNSLQSPIHVAIKAGKLEAFKYLIKKGRSNLKCTDLDGNWPIHLSAQEGCGHMTWSQLCILGLPALHVVNKHGCTPYDLASMYDTPRHKELLSELEWQKRQSDGSDVKRHSYLLWFYYLLLPIVSYGAAIVATRFMPGYHALVFFPVVVFNVVTVKNSLHRLEHVSRWPQPIHAGAFAAGLIHTILVYLIAMLPYMDKQVNIKLLSIPLIAVILVLYIRLLTKDPGVMTSSAQDEKTGKSLTFLDVCTPDKWGTFCISCEIVQEKFTKHCKLCERCMLGMDHHCLFLLRCIARDNHILFVWFIILCLLNMVIFIYGVFLYVCEAYAALSWWEVLTEMLAVDSWVLTILLLNCASVLWGSGLIMYQFQVISNGYTAYFQPHKYHGNLLSPYEKVTNVVFFLLNRPPLIVNPSVHVKAYEQVV